ncbi:4-phosphoerythronate dehydrogenase PdxB [Shewanella sp. C32]|uniref:Erythronate-4-phosphate dehydrogenase n=1 Tax=Shewanella electrica TaxID=515560 RepID=A0ABT2FKN5_9GAMM|nr:4-phosphoerythronate dehydrogenase PdxB [Shewanella electrica]MCH1923683.1 4-phosphoerythronate dehydrogenase PdxB [Shewanella electrica]MCS4556902.1 4-phosphoerythronate dehydrogenase PdxB [Shewanella electrica]
MKLVVDENMPYVRELFADFGEIVAVNGRHLSAEQVSDADVLLVRSVTQVNSALLAQNSQLKFVGSATIGTDHIDQDYLASRNIPFSSAPGCNATSVGEYVFNALLELAEKYGADLHDKTVGIVGAGNTGSAVARCLSAWGVNVMLCDPPLQRSGDDREFFPLDTLIAQADVLTFHVPLTHDGADATFHLLDAAKIARLKSNMWLINACRGEVIDNHALLARQQTQPMPVVLDVWEGEPQPLAALVPLVDIATPHIAGYSLEGKALGTFMLYQRLCELLGRSIDKSLADLLPKAWFQQVNLRQTPDQAGLLRLCRFVYDLRDDDRQFRKIHQIPDGFDNMRKNHRHRREFSALALVNADGSEVDCLTKLGFAGVVR